MHSPRAARRQTAPIRACAALCSSWRLQEHWLEMEDQQMCFDTNAYNDINTNPCIRLDIAHKAKATAEKADLPVSVFLVVRSPGARRQRRSPAAVVTSHAATLKTMLAMALHCVWCMRLFMNMCVRVCACNAARRLLHTSLICAA